MPYSISELCLTLVFLMPAALAAQSDNHEGGFALHPVLLRNRTTSLAQRDPQSSENYGCDIVEDECGIYCIPSTFTCCPDEQGGCPIDETCVLGDNGKYGCCPMFETCVGNGGTNVVDDWDDIDEDTSEEDDNDTYDYSDDARAVKPGLGLSGILFLVTFMIGVL